MTDLGRIARARRSTKAGAGRATTVLKPGEHTENDFITRIQLALDMTPIQLANALDRHADNSHFVGYRPALDDIADRQGPRADASEFDTDPFWNRLLEYVNQRLAGLMAVQEELARKQRMDRRAAYERRQAVLNR